MQGILRSIFALFVFAFVLGACGGDSSTGIDDGGDAPGDSNPPPREIKENPSFQNDIREMFARRGCTAAGCHGSAAAGGLELASNPYANLIDVPASNCGSLIRVVPNDAANSYLVAKVQANPPCGSRMPLGGQALDNVDIANLVNWINGGARNN